MGRFSLVQGESDHSYRRVLADPLASLHLEARTPCCPPEAQLVAGGGAVEGNSPRLIDPTEGGRLSGGRRTRYCTESREGSKAAIDSAKEHPGYTIQEVTTLEVTQGQILSQSPTDATRFWWYLYGS